MEQFREDGTDSLAAAVREKRGSAGVRRAAAEIGIAPATLSRVERGGSPDLMNYRKISRWLGRAPGLDSRKAPVAAAWVHPDKDDAMFQETVESLSEMILAAQRALAFRHSSESGLQP